MASNWEDLWVYRLTLKREVIITLLFRGLGETHLGPLRENLHHWLVINWMTNNKIRQTLLGNTAHMLLLIIMLISFSKPQWGWPWLSWMTNCLALLFVSPWFFEFRSLFFHFSTRRNLNNLFFCSVSLVLNTKTCSNERWWQSTCLCCKKKAVKFYPACRRIEIWIFFESS